MRNQKSNQEFWIDESGTRIPYNRTTKVERLMERKSAELVRKANNLNEGLVKYKETIQAICNEVEQAYMLEKGIQTKGKGNFTWHNFDRSIKVERDVNERIVFDDMGVAAAREKLDLFLDAHLDSKIAFIKDMVTDAFQTSGGKLDTKKVMGLLKYRQKIKQPLFQEAMNLLEESIRNPSSKIYYRVWVKDTQEQYKAIELNFSSI